MKSFHGIGSIVPLLVLTTTPLALTAQNKRVAVYDFNYAAVRGDVINVFGSDKPVGAQVANRIISKLVNNATAPFDVIDRNEIDTIMKEQNLKFSDRFDPRDAPRLGRLLNVDAIVTGSVDEIADQVKNNRVGLGSLGFGKVQSVADVTVSVRVISTETGRIFIADQVDNEQTYNLGKGGRFGNNSGEGDSQNLHPAAVPADRALQAAADQIAAKIIAKAADLPARRGAAMSSASRSASSGGSLQARVPAVSAAPSAVPEELLVGRIDGSKIFITGGQNAGLKVNDYFEVRHPTGSMKDAEGHVIQTDERVDTIVVTDVEDQFAVAHSVHAGSTSLAKVGDRLKRVKAPVVRRRPATTARRVHQP